MSMRVREAQHKHRMTGESSEKKYGLLRSAWKKEGIPLGISQVTVCSYPHLKLLRSGPLASAAALVPWFEGANYSTLSLDAWKRTDVLFLCLEEIFCYSTIVIDGTSPSQGVLFSKSIADFFIF